MNVEAFNYTVIAFKAGGIVSTIEGYWYGDRDFLRTLNNRTDRQRVLDGAFRV